MANDCLIHPVGCHRNKTKCVVLTHKVSDNLGAWVTNLRCIYVLSKNIPRKALKNLSKSPVLIHEASDEGAWFDPGPRFDAQWWIGATCSGHSNSNIDLFYFSTFLLFYFSTFLLFYF